MTVAGMAEPTRIYLFCRPAPGWGPKDVVGYAVAEDGRGLGSHLSSSVVFSMHDMGATSDWKHEGYAKACPGGYVLEWVDNEDEHDGLREALRLNQERAERSAEEGL